VPRNPRLYRDLAKLAALQLELRTTLDRVDRTLKRLATAVDADGSARPAPMPNRPLRVQVLDIVHELGVMAYSREIIAYAFARYDLVIPPSRFGSLSSDEQQAFGRRDAPRSRNRTLWLCFGLRHDDGAPVRRLLARSDWPLEKRMWAPTTGRVQHLRMLVRLCDLALDEARVHFANPDALTDLIQAYARDLPVKTLPGVHAFADWQERALALLEEHDLEAMDYELRQQAAERWSGLADKHQLFGLEPLEAPDPAGDLESAE
jgi:hypothetical protein